MADSAGPANATGDDRSFLADVPDDPAAADEAARRAAADAAFEAVSDDTLAGYAERLVALGVKRFWLGADVAEDLAQEAITRTVEHRRKWDPRRGPLYPFLKDVLKSLVEAHWNSWENKRFVHLQRPAEQGRVRGLERDPEGTVDLYENLAGPADGSAVYGMNPERVLLAKEQWEADLEDFRAVTTNFADYPDAMGVIRAAQHDIVRAAEQAGFLGLPVARVYLARKRIAEFLRELFKQRSEKARQRVAVRPRRSAASPASGPERGVDLDKDAGSPQNNEEP